MSDNAKHMVITALGLPMNISFSSCYVAAYIIARAGPLHPPHDLREQLLRHGYFGQLKDYSAGAANYLGSDLDQLLLPTAQTPMVQCPR